MKKMVPFLAAYLLLFSALFGVLSAWPRNTSVVSPVLLDRVGNLILDAGHGGEDGGAVAADGTVIRAPILVDGISPVVKTSCKK